MKLTQSWTEFTDEYRHTIEHKEIKLTEDETLSVLEAIWRLTGALARFGAVSGADALKLGALSEMVGVVIDSIDRVEVSR